MQQQKNNPRSLMMLIASTLIFGTIGIFRRYIPLSSGLLACFRGFCGALFLFVILKVQKRPFRHQIGVRNLIVLVIAGAAMGVNWILLFEAYNYTTVATATLCYYMQPTIVILLSPLVFKEKLSAKKLACVMISVIGMIFVSGIMENGFPGIQELKGVLCGLGAAALYATVIILNKLLPPVDTSEKTIIELLSAAVILVPYLLLTEDFSAIRLSALAMIMLLIVGFIHTGVAYVLYFGSMNGLKGQSIAIFSYIDPVTALFLSAVLLHEHLSFFGIIGAVLILASALWSEIFIQ